MPTHPREIDPPRAEAPPMIQCWVSRVSCDSWVVRFADDTERVFHDAYDNPEWAAFVSESTGCDPEAYTDVWWETIGNCPPHWHP